VPDIGLHTFNGYCVQCVGWHSSLSSSTMSTDLLVIVDDDSSAFSYSSESMNPWVLDTFNSRWYRGTYRFSHIGTFTFTFNGRRLSTHFISLSERNLGTSAAFIGSTPPSLTSQEATVQIDNGTFFAINYDDPTPPTYKQWFTTPTLPDGNHTITIRNLYGTSIDYAVVKVGNDTSLTGQTVIVDDDSPLIQYSGQWSRNTDEFVAGSPTGSLTGCPYGNVTHHSSNAGDNFTFRFSGKQPVNFLNRTILTLSLF
jgi:hypothetical protein